METKLLFTRFLTGKTRAVKMMKKGAPKREKMRKRIFKSMCLLSAAAVVIAYLLISVVLYQEFFENLKSEIKTEAEYIEAAVEGMGAKYFERLTQTGTKSRITWIDADGNVLYDSLMDVGKMENHSTRPEFLETHQKGHGEATRVSNTLGEQTFYYALQLKDGTILRVASTMESVLVTVKECIPFMFLIIFAIFLGTAFFAGWNTRRLVRPINELDLEKPLENEVYDELKPLLLRIEKLKEQIRLQVKQARERQEEFTAITENMREGLIVINEKAVVLTINAAAQRLFHCTREDCISKHILNVNRDKNLREAVEQAAGGKSYEARIEIEELTYKLLANPVYADEKIRGAVIIILDITQKQKVEEMRKEFSANVSHELKTPLMSISGYAEIMKNGLVKKEDIPVFIERIYAEAQRLTHLVEDIIKLSRLDENNAEPDFEAVDLLELANEVKKQLEEKSARHGIHFSLEGSHERVMGIRHVLNEMLFNICDNALNYNKENGSVCVCVRKEGERVLLSVKDTGIGIPKEYQERIFERFFRVDKSHSRETGGTGLGLSIVKHGAILHHATVEVESEEGIGTLIKLLF